MESGFIWRADGLLYFLDNFLPGAFGVEFCPEDGVDRSHNQVLEQ